MGYKSLEVRMKPTVRGVGYLGGNLDLKSTHNGKLCKIYTQWYSMIARCYDEKYHIRFPTYIGCYVSDKYKDLLDPRAYEALYNYTVDIDD